MCKHIRNPLFVIKNKDPLYLVSFGLFLWPFVLIHSIANRNSLVIVVFVSGTNNSIVFFF